MRVMKNNLSVNKAAQIHGVPVTTLKDRVAGRIDVENFEAGGSAVFSKYEEEKFCEHLKQMASMGYGLTRSQTILLASEYAISVGKRTVDNMLTKHWLYGFLGRWPELKTVKPSSLDSYRAASCCPSVIETYYTELSKKIEELGLSDCPECIFNIDEKGISRSHNPQTIICGVSQKPQAITSDREMMTVIGAGNALGVNIPPGLDGPTHKYSRLI